MAESNMAAVRPPSHRPLAGALLVIGAAAAWSTGGLFVRSISLGAFTILFWRSAFAALWIAILARLSGASLALGKTVPIKAVAVIILSASASMLLFVPALMLTSVASVMGIYAILPLTTAVADRVFFGAPFGTAIAVATAAVVLGVAIMLQADAPHRHAIAGDVLALLMTVCITVMTIGVARHPSLTSLSIVYYANFVVALASLPWATPFPVSDRNLYLLAGFGFFQMVAGLVLFTLGLRRLPATDATLLGTLELPLAPIWVWLVFDERPSLQVALGALIVIGAVCAYLIGHAYRTRPKRAARAPRKLG